MGCLYLSTALNFLSHIVTDQSGLNSTPSGRYSFLSSSSLPIIHSFQFLIFLFPRARWLSANVIRTYKSTYSLKSITSANVRVVLPTTVCLRLSITFV